MAGERIVIEILTEVAESQVKKSFGTIEKQGLQSGKISATNFSKSFGSTVGGSFKSVFGGVFNRLGGQVAALGATLGAAFAARGVVRAGATIERLETQFETLLGSAKAAQGQIQELSAFAANTPFRLEGLADATSQLLSFGFESDTIIDRLKVLGDVASGSNSDIKEVALIFGQVSAAGKLTGERLLQLQERAIPIGSALAKSLGVAESQVRDLVSSGKVGFKEFEDAFKSLAGAGGLFEGATARQAKTIGGLISTLEDNFFALQAAVAKAFGPIFKRILGEGITLLQGLTRNFQTNSDAIVQSTIRVARAINENVIPPLVGIKRIGTIVFNAVIVGINTLIAGLGKLGGAVGSVISFFGGDGQVTQALANFSESTAAVLEESIIPLNEATNSLFDPIAFQEKTEEFLVGLENFAAGAEPIADRVVSKFKDTQKQITKTADGTGKALANIINQALVQTTSRGIQTLTKALISGGEGFRAFGKQVFSILGDLSIKLGETLLLTGIGIESLKSLSGAAAIAAGAGLIALGTILKSLGDGPGLGGAPAGAGASGFGGGIAQEDNEIAVQDEEREEPSTSVAVNIQGDVIDSDETGTRLVQILNDAFDKDGVVITNGSFA